MKNNCCFCIGPFGVIEDNGEATCWCSLGVCTYVATSRDYGTGLVDESNTWCTLLGSYTERFEYNSIIKPNTNTIVNEDYSICTLCGCYNKNINYYNNSIKTNISLLCFKANCINKIHPKSNMSVPEQITMSEPEQVEMRAVENLKKID
jgi:hypothetical protein